MLKEAEAKIKIDFEKKIIYCYGHIPDGTALYSLTKEHYRHNREALKWLFPYECAKGCLENEPSRSIRETYTSPAKIKQVLNKSWSIIFKEYLIK